MSENLRILSAQSDIHNLQCQISAMKRMLLSDAEITLNEYEVEGMIDQLDDAFDRMERLNAKLETMKQDVANIARFDTLQQAGNVVAILAETRATHKKQKTCAKSRNGNGNGRMQDIPNLSA